MLSNWHTSLYFRYFPVYKDQKKAVRLIKPMNCHTDNFLLQFQAKSLVSGQHEDSTYENINSF